MPICIFLGESESKIVSPSKRKKKKCRLRSKDLVSPILSNQCFLKSITCCFFGFWISHGIHMLTSINFLKCDSKLCLFVRISKFQLVWMFSNNHGGRQRRREVEAISATLKCINYVSWFDIKWSNTWIRLERFYFSVVILVGIFAEEGHHTLAWKRITMVNPTCLPHYYSKGKKKRIDA